MAAYRLFSSSLLTVLFLAGAGLPGFRHIDDVQAQEPLRLFSMTELNAASNGHYFATADINSRGVEVLIDTGASTVALSYEDAERIGLRPHTLDFTIPVSTANGTGKAARVVLREVEIDNVRVDNVEGVVLTKGAMKGTLLGMSFLGRLRSFSVESGRLVLKN